MVIDQQHVELVAAEQALAAFEDLLEHRLGVGHRTADHAQDVGSGLLLFQRLLRLVEQPRVLDCDHRLVGEGLEKRVLLVAERRRRDAHDVDGADALAFPQHGLSLIHI